MNQRCSGDPTVTWQQHFKKNFAKKPFSKALFIMCGNGWVEREFFDLGIVTSADAFDYSQDLLDEAEGEKGTRDISYFQADVNTLQLPENEYDLVVNMAGLHHVQFLNRFQIQLVKSLNQSGKMVSFDYVGPTRNQYPAHQWAIAKKVNRLLPSQIQAELNYPDLRTMLSTDPTEAINSAQILKTHDLYFSFDDYRAVGGGIAYLLLTHNTSFFQAQKRIQTAYARALTKIDAKLTDRKQLPVLFAYWVSSPKKSTLKNQYQIQFLLTKEILAELLRDIYLILRFFPRNLARKLKNVLKLFLKY